MLALGLVGSEYVGAGRALAPAPPCGVGAAMFLLQEVDGPARVREIMTEVARCCSEMCPGTVLLHQRLVIVCMTATPAPSASTHLRGESVNAVADGLLVRPPIWRAP